MIKFTDNQKKKYLYFYKYFMVTRTRIAKASLDDLLRKYPILCPFRLCRWQTAERWTIMSSILCDEKIKNQQKKYLYFYKYFMVTRTRIELVLPP